MKISVALCTYNGERYLPEQLESIAAQVRPPDELVVCDDHSSDRTHEILRSFAAASQFPVRVYVNDENLGSTRNFAQAVGLCEGSAIALSDQDDVWLPQKLRDLESVFSAEPDVGLVFTDADIVDQYLCPSGSRLWDLTFTDEERRLVAEGRALDVLMMRNVVTGATMAFRSCFKELVLPIPIDDTFIHDGWIAFIVAAVAGVKAIPEPSIKYRQHPNQQMGIEWAKHNLPEHPSKAKTLEDEEEAAARALYYANEVQRLRHFARKLKAVQDNSARFAPALSSRIAMMHDLAAHYCVRGNIPRNKLARVPLISKELLTLRYHRYSKGLSSAALDLIR